MADVTGPISSLPDSVHSVPAGRLCDVCQKPATIRRQGETDSFGSEMHDLCADCDKKSQAEANDLSKGSCEWCRKEATDLRPARDYDEGSAGPVYYVCGECRRKQAREAEDVGDDLLFCVEDEEDEQDFEEEEY